MVVVAQEVVVVKVVKVEEVVVVLTVALRLGDMLYKHFQ